MAERTDPSSAGAPSSDIKICSISIRLTSSPIGVQKCRVFSQQGLQSVTVACLSGCTGASLEGDLVQALRERCCGDTAITAAGITLANPRHLSIQA